MRGVELLAVGEMLARCERVLAASPADATELVWLEIGRAEASAGGGGEVEPPVRERTVIVRVEERGRVGFHRTDAESTSEIENALRFALAQARGNPPGGALLAGAENGDYAGGGAAEAPADSFDSELAKLDPAAAGRLLEQRLEADERARLSWAEAHVVVATSRGLRRRAEVTAATLSVRAGRGPGAGRAAASARTLAALGAEAVRGRARERRAVEGGEGAAPLPGEPISTVLAPEAVIPLLELLNRHALSARAFRDGVSPFAGALGERRLDPAITLRDDGTDPAGLPFPFDLAGAAKRPVELVAAGVVAARDLAPTPRALDGDEPVASNLFLQPGTLDDAALLAAAGDGLWIGDLERVECFDPAALRFRAVARGVRRLGGGALGPAVGDLVWEDSLLRLFGEVAGTGSEPVVLAGADGVFGGTSAPAVAFPAVTGLRPAPAAEPPSQG